MCSISICLLFLCYGNGVFGASQKGQKHAHISRTLLRAALNSKLLQIQETLTSLERSQ